ncbi:hypothetical protein Vretifemale_12546, partial [Volvox reticuliferus]
LALLSDLLRSCFVLHTVCDNQLLVASFVKEKSNMAPRGIPADILALSVPILFAGGAFSTMLYRIIKVDPEQTAGITPDTKEAIQKGETYKNSIRQMFVGRSRSIFNNDVTVQ